MSRTLRIDVSNKADRRGFWWRKPLRGKPHWIWPLIAALTLFAVCTLQACKTAPPVVIQPIAVREPVTAKFLPPPKPYGYFSRRLREILEGS